MQLEPATLDVDALDLDSTVETAEIEHALTDEALGPDPRQQLRASAIRSSTRNV